MVFKLFVRTLIESIVIGHAWLWQSGWWSCDVQRQISLVSIVCRPSFEGVQMLVAYWSGASSQVSSAKSAQRDDWQFVSLVVSCTEQNLNHTNNYCVDSCFRDVKHLHCSTQDFAHFLVTFLRHFINIDWVGVLNNISAKADICGNTPPIFWHTDGTHRTHLPAASIDQGSIACGSRYFLCQRGCAKSKPIHECWSCLLSIVLLVRWRSVMKWLQWLCIAN